jgi:hypothetical protein
MPLSDIGNVNDFKGINIDTNHYVSHCLTPKGIAKLISCVFSAYNLAEHKMRCSAYRGLLPPLVP